jgi:hypothetical protein
MADFMRETTLVPSSFYSVSDRRVFIVETPPRPMLVGGGFGVPAVIVDTRCRLQIEAKAKEQRDAADVWVIHNISRQGGCANV